MRRIIIDTNVWISFLIGKQLSGLVDLFDKNTIKVIFCNEQFEELLDVLNRPKFRKYFTRQKIDEFLQLIEDISEIIKITSEIELCRDIKDNYLLSAAIDGEADYLITGDKDLLVIKEIEKTSIIDYQQFSRIISTLI